ncbi:MAG: hypothetical protein JWO97_3756 [Acidobacteria bacterium]|nr:hypothetical protein [Acidobacteriota bacterium]
MRFRTALFSLLVLLVPAIGAAQEAKTWQFVVAGDSRNCGNVVMPLIAAGAKKANAAFYWHLGDFRALANFDEDLVEESKVAGKPLTILGYMRTAWPDFIRNEVEPFSPIPFFPAIGNHELYGKTRQDYVAQFADWLTQPAIQRQRLADDPRDHIVRPYYHWQIAGTDFISLDNATPDMFDDAQLDWFERVLKADNANPAIQSIVVGMHAALPHSLSCDHSMNDYSAGEPTGSRVYRDLLGSRKAGKQVYILASHSHFIMSNIFNSDYWRNNGGVLPGWIIGTAGAIRYRLPPQASQADFAQTDVYGYLLATVNPPGSPAGTIRFDFQKVDRKELPAEIVARYSQALVDQCFDGNREMKPSRDVDCDKAVPCTPPARP